MRHKRTVYFSLTSILCVFLIVGCGSLPDKNSSSYQLKSKQITKKPGARNLVVNELYRQHQEWRGVRYRLGGMNKSGIDCSAFVQLTYQSRLGIHLPRTARQQSRLGTPIRKYQLAPGDLIFFRTGPTSKHVGIYLEENKFLHASQRKGVTISRLDNVYWQSKYWKSVRL